MPKFAAGPASTLGLLLLASPACAALPASGPTPFPSGHQPGFEPASLNPVWQPGSDQLDPSQLCRAAIAATEHATGIPDAFLSAMGRVESGRLGGGTVNPWPWTVNAAGSGHFYATKQEAEAAVRQFLASGLKSLDVGCLQVNLFYHPEAFATLDQAFDPAANAAFAAKLLLDLFHQTGSWPRAAAAYHSMTPAIGLAYQQKVLEEWATPDRPSLKARKDERPAALALAAPPAARLLPIAPPEGPIQTASSAMPPAFGFNRRFMLAQPHLAGARGLAAYRAAPVQIAMRQPSIIPSRVR